MKFDRQSHVSLDLETDGDDEKYGLQPWRVEQGVARISAASIAWYDDGKMQVKGALSPAVDEIREMLEMFIRNNSTVIAWNAPFDMSWLIAVGLGDLVQKIRWADAMLWWKHGTNSPEYTKKGEARKKYALEEAVAEFYPKHTGFKQIKSFHTTDPAELEQLLLRNKMDAATTLRLAEKFWDDLSDKQQRCVAIESASLWHIATANLQGLHVDGPAAATLSAGLAEVARDRLEALSEFGATPEILASPQQLGKLLFEDWQLPVLRRTDSGQPSTDGDTLHELAAMDERATLVRDYREANNNRTKFVSNIIASCAYNGDDKTHPSAKVFGTYSGRLTYSSSQGRGKAQVQTGFAIHQMKRQADFRALIEAPEDHDIVELDAANQEYRWMAILSRDPVMLAMCEPGEDGHGYMGGQIAGHTYEWMKETAHTTDATLYAMWKAARQMGKFANLAFQYRIGVAAATQKARAEHGMNVTEKRIEQVKNTYLSSYKMVKKYWRDSIRIAAAQGYAETLAGRRVQLVGNWQGALGWSLESTALNFPIQGVGADQKFLALACIKPLLVKYEGRFYYELHDGLYFVIPKRNTHAFVTEAKALLDNLPYRKAWGFIPPVLLPWDAKVGTSWGTLKEFKV